MTCTKVFRVLRQSPPSPPRETPQRAAEPSSSTPSRPLDGTPSPRTLHRPLRSFANPRARRQSPSPSSRTAARPPVVQRGKAELPRKRSVLTLERRHEHQHAHASIPHERIARRLDVSGVSHRVQRDAERRDADADVVAQSPLLVIPAKQVPGRQPALIETLPLQRLVQRRHRFDILVPGKAASLWHHT